jgi:hypothetical protein
MKASVVYAGSDGDLTTRYYAELQKRGAIGLVAVNLFRAQKCSARAKKYTRRYKGAAYDRKSWSLDNLCAILAEHAGELGIRYGWKLDPDTPLRGEPAWVLYVDIPQGQVSFHSPSRGAGPDYPEEFDGEHKSAERIIAFCDAVYQNVIQAAATSDAVCQNAIQPHGRPVGEERTSRGAANLHRSTSRHTGGGATAGTLPTQEALWQS